MKKLEVLVRQALARGYCTNRNKHKILDPYLIEDMVVEVAKAGLVSIEEIEQEFNKYVTTPDYHIHHGEIDDRKEICQWGFRWFIQWLRHQAIIAKLSHETEE